MLKIEEINTNNQIEILMNKRASRDTSPFNELINRFFHFT